MSKRPIIVDETAPFAFKFPNGEPIDETILFSTYRYDMENIILSSTKAKNILRILEQAGKSSAEWIRKSFIWRKLFARDYPLEYFLALDADSPGQMNPTHAELLNKMSNQSRDRTWTLWKRYYEYIFRLKSIAKWHPFEITAQGPEIDMLDVALADKSATKRSPSQRLPMTAIAYPTVDILRGNRQVVCFISSEDGTENFVVLQLSRYKFKFEKMTARAPNISYTLLDHIRNPHPYPEDFVSDFEYVITPDRFSVVRLDFGLTGEPKNKGFIGLEEASLVDVYFLDDEFEDIEPFKLVSSCIMCDKEATHFWQGMPKYRFCSNQCAQTAWSKNKYN